MITLTILLIVALLCVLVGCLTGLLTLVGVLGIDSLLFAQGFRAYENVFSLITQCSLDHALDAAVTKAARY